MLRVRFVALLIAAAVLAPAVAQADEMDVALNRLKTPAAPGTACPEATSEGQRAFCGAEDDWKRIMSQLGMSMAPPVMTPARTVGPGGFSIGFETWTTGIDEGQQYWRLGTEGDSQDSGSCRDGVEGCNRFPKGALTWSRLAVRKGFPFGFQLGLSIGHGFSTSYWTWGVEVQWALFEGFRESWPAFIPDFSVRGMVQTMTGDSEFNLTVPSVDLTISKPFVGGKMVELTPFMSGQLLWMVADSELVDLTPNTNAVSACRPQPPGMVNQQNTTRANDGDPSNDPTSQILCQDSPNDFTNNHVFNELRAIRWRLSFGLKFRYELLTLTGAFAFDVKEPGAADGDVDFDEGATLPRQWTVSFGAGLEL